MCGICGIYKRTSHDELIGSVHTMLDAMRYRGPDQQGFHVFNHCAIGVNRLSIIDMKTGDQPIHNEDNSIWIVYNGEIYNYQLLRKELASKGHLFYTNTDTEVIIHLYEQYGIEGFEKLNGMFAFAVYDEKQEKLILTRDRIGIKPLYYSLPDGLVFASEMKTLLAMKHNAYKLNLSGIAQYLSYDYTPAPNTMVNGIFKLMPGMCLIKDKGTMYEKQFVNNRVNAYLEVKNDGQSENEIAGQLGEILSEAVKDQMAADVPVGIFLSGGIDSSAIAYFASKIKPDINSFSISFEEPSFDESTYARLMSDKLGLKHYSKVFTCGLFKELFHHLIDFMDEPIADPSIIPTYALSKLAGKQVKVVLSGEGGDEMFAGYPTYTAHKFASLYNSLPGILRKGMIEPLIKLLPVSDKNLSFDFIAKRFVSSSSLQAVRRHTQWMGGFAYQELSLLLRKELFRSIEDSLYQPVKELIEYTKGLSDPETANIMDIVMYLPDDLLVKIDRATMAASIESRVPLLDNRVIRFSKALPFEYKLKGMTHKYILKKLMKDKLPDSIINRKKKGFGIPLTKWLRHDFRHEAEMLLSKDSVESIGVFNYPYISRLLQEHIRGSRDNRKKLWPIIVLVKWLQRYRYTV